MFQWYLFVLIFAVGMFANITGQVYTENSYGQREQRYGWVPVLIILVPLIYLAGTRDDMRFGDTSAYRIGFHAMPSSLRGLAGYFTDSSKDRGFTVFTVFLKSFIGENDVLYFLIVAALCLICVFCIYKMYSCNFIITIFLFIASADYIQWTYNGIRQFLAVSLIFACTGLLLKQKYVSVVIVILMASTIHASALIMLPIVFIVQGKPFNKKTVFFLFAMLVAIAFIDQFTDIIANIMENTQYSGEVDQFLSTEGTSIQRVLVYSMPAFIALLFRKRIEMANNQLINMAVNFSIATFGLMFLSAFSSGLFLGRLGIYTSLYNYILLPWEVENIFTKSSARLIYALMIICYFAFYYYQVVITWGL